MGRFAKLSYTSNPKLQQYIGCVGELEKNARGGYAFSMRDNGLIINTSGAQFGTILGDVDVPNCRTLGFQTQSGTMYQFAFMDYERVIDGTRMVGNQFMGYENEGLACRLDDAKAEANALNARVSSAERESYLDYGK